MKYLSFILGCLILNVHGAEKASKSAETIAPEFIAYAMIEKEKLPLYKHVLPTKTMPPLYPDELRRNGVEGSVTVGAVVSKKGNVEATFVTEADAPKILQRAAMDAVKRWRFPPMLIEGKPIRYAAITPIVFHVD